MSFIVFLFWVPVALAALPGATLSVIDPTPQTEFEKARRPQIEQHLRICGTCQVLNLTPYNSSGHFDAASVMEQLDKVPRDNSVVLILWNKAYEPTKDQKLIEKIKSLQEQGVLFVVTAGRPAPQGATLGLRKTLWGQLPQAVIIGELTERERLLPGTFFGPQMLTAIKPPSDVLGQDVSALIFSARLVSQLNEKKTSEWVDFLRNKKATSRRMWPSLEEFFGR